MAPHGNSDLKKNPFKAIIAGGITGGIEICITYPTEYVKTQMQLFPQDAKKGLKYIISSTYQKYNVFGFYRGLSALIMFSIPKTASRFGANEWLKNHVFTVSFLVFLFEFPDFFPEKNKNPHFPGWLRRRDH